MDDGVKSYDGWIFASVCSFADQEINLLVA